VGERIIVYTGLGKKYMTVFEKQLKQKRTRNMASVVKHLPHKHEVLSSNSRTMKRKRKEGRKGVREIKGRKKVYLGSQCWRFSL
jgi:hypothetical protein